MSVHTTVSFRFTPEIREALNRIKARDGAPLSEQLRRAVLLWIRHKGLPAPAMPATAARRR